MHASIVIAVEQTLDRRIGERKYAEADARDFAAVLAPHGFAGANSQLLLNDRATKTSVESVVRTTLKRLKAGDTLYLYYAGHSFAKRGEGNYLTCYDTRLDDAEQTSIDLDGLLRQFQSAACQRIVLFLDASPCDASHWQQPEIDDWQRDYRALDSAELVRVFEPAKGETERQCICFSACQPDEQSHTSSELGHGIWAWHLIQAWDGRDRTALDGTGAVGTQLTARSLQAHLTRVVPATLRKTNPKVVQTPCFYGDAHHDLELADLKELLASRNAAKHHRIEQVKDSILLAESVESITSLSGFKKGYRLPDRRSSSAQTFINSAASEDIKNETDRLRAALKAEFGFTRLQLAVHDQGEGGATITTPLFNYNVSVEQDTGDPAKVVWRRSVDAIVDPEKILSDEFERVFAELFDTVELSLHDGVDIERLIDFIESRASSGIQVDYDEGATSCVVRIQGHKAEIKVAGNKFSVVSPRAKTPKLLLKSFFDLQQVLTDTHQVVLIPFGSL